MFPNHPPQPKNMHLHTTTLKEKNLKLIINKQKTVTQVAVDLGVSRQTVHKWLSKYKDLIANKPNPSPCPKIDKQPVDTIL